VALARLFRLGPTADSILHDLAASRFGGNNTEAVRASITVAAKVYMDPSTVMATDPDTALRMYIESHTCFGSRSTEPHDAP